MSVKCPRSRVTRDAEAAVRNYEPASAVTALREMVLQQLTSTQGLPNAAQVIQDHTNCGLGCGLEIPTDSFTSMCMELCVANGAVDPACTILPTAKFFVDFAA